MQKLTWVALAMFLAVGCSDKWDKALKEMEGFKNDMCACKDVACTKDVKKKMRDWEDKMSKEFGKDEKPPEKLISKGDKIEADMKQCRKDIEKTAGAAAAADSIKKMVAFKDEMCACKDAACTTKVTDEMTKWSKEQAADPTAMGVLDDAQRKQMTDNSDALAKCMTAAMTPAAPATP